MIQQPITRRNLLKGGGGVVAGWSVLQVSGPAAALGSPGSGDHVAWLSHGTTLEETYPGRPGDVVIEWLDQPAEVPPPAQSVVGNLLDWESLRTRLTPADDFFTVKHYDLPVIDPTTWQVEITSLVARPVTLSLADLIARPRREVEFTLECSGNTGLPFFIGGIGNAVWGGTQLSSVLRRARPLDSASEVVFWGTDAGTVTIRDNSGVLSAGTTGIGEPDAGGGLDITITEQFARSMSLDEAMAPGNLLCYEMNGPAHVVRNGDAYRVIGVAWGGAIAAVEVSIDGGEWQSAELADAPRHHGGRGLAWQFWTFDWGSPGAGQHTVASRAIDRNGEVQPAPDDPLIADKRTYWESNGQITRTVAI
jgi:DMSO/TMAO reductase YedYZ molybdopterin-dependent catalytic subunit